MRLLRDVPVNRKLTIIAMVSSCAALLLACLAFVANDLLLYRRSLVSELEGIAEMLGDNSSAALTFDDPGSAEQTLRSLHAHPHIVGGAVYSKEGRLFAQYRRSTAGDAFRPPAVEPQGHRFGKNSLELFRPIELAGERAGTVYVHSDLSEMRGRLRQYSVAGVLVLVAASLVAFLLASKLQKAISGPISHLAGVVGQVASQKDYSVRAVKKSEDELGRLIDGFNEMLNQIQTQDQALQEARDSLERRVEVRTEELRREIVERKEAQAEVERIHKELLDASRRGGMAEIATNVLHNVGNVLNSVNVSANLVGESVRGAQVSGLAKVVALLREHPDDLGAFLAADPKGRHVPAFLAELAEHLEAQQRKTLAELESLRTNVEHIKEIVAMQQSYAKVSGVSEIVDLADLVEDSLRLNGDALARHRVETVREYAPVPAINVDKHRVLQILVNLVRNAKYACEDSGRTDKRVILRIAAGGEGVRISVVDNGVGIAPENLTRIFHHGFTTRRHGHGFGLHSGALAAREMAGSLSAESGGLGHGATFTLELPLEPPGERR